MRTKSRRLERTKEGNSTHHLFEFVVGKVVLLLQLIALDGQTLLQLLHLLHSLPDLLQADVQVQLLLLQV